MRVRRRRCCACTVATSRSLRMLLKRVVGRGLSPMRHRMTIGIVGAMCFCAGVSATCPPFEVAKVTPIVGGVNDNAGSAVAIGSGWAFVGAPNHDAGGENAGAVFTFVESDGMWTPGPTIQAAPVAAGARFGGAIALDGDTLVVGARGLGAGSAFVYRHDAGVWSHEGTLTPGDGSSGDAFGASVAVLGDRVIVGAWGHNDTVGAAYVFERAGGVWSQAAKLTPMGGQTEDEFGISVSLSGNKALVGAWGDSQTDIFSGAAYVFSRNATTGVWSQDQKLIASDGSVSDLYGISVTMDGDRAIIGAFGRNAPGANRAGAAYAYRFDDNTQSWGDEQLLLASDPAFFSFFGNAVSLRGGRALIGAEIDGMDVGAAYVFELDEMLGDWQEVEKLVASDAAPGRVFGYSVWLGIDQAIIGAIGDNVNGSGSGSAYVFTFAGEAPAIVEQPVDQEVEEGETAVFSVEASGAAPLSYRWRLDGAPLFDDGRITGADTDTLTISMVDGDVDAGEYDVLVENGCDVAVSDAAVLTVISGCIGDFNNDGVVNAQDLGQLLSRWGACPPAPVDCVADITGTGVVNAQDLSQLLSRWGPCP
ncbi:MAG: hypothetical protein EA376_01685 [Phycisphaeraceae bacterium]|nr:MAG: hypothetical protein EA376_01685 [Phycisphaeraceae bacterium]